MSGPDPMAPDPIAEAAARALYEVRDNRELAPTDTPWTVFCAEYAVAAVRPLIEAEVREAVARELDDRERRWRTRLDATEDLGRGTYYSGLALAYHDAARIARGGYEGTGSDA